MTTFRSTTGFSITPARRVTLAGVALLALTACNSQPLDFDLRGLTDGFSTANAAQEARSAARPTPDANGVISYPNYQVAIARNNDTVPAIAERVGLPASELARYNGISLDSKLRSGEVVALPRRVGGATSTPTQSGTIPSGGRIDVTTLANEALSETGGTTQAAAAPRPQATAPTAEAIRHQVQRGETAYSIARRYGVSVRSIADWNGLGSDLAVQEGRYILVPDTGNAAPQPAQPAAVTSTTVPGQGSPTPVPPSASQPLPEPEAAAPPASAPTQPVADIGATQTSTSEMEKPVGGPIIRDYDKNSSKFILFSAPAGTSVKAAKAGTVKLVSTNADGVKILVIDHGDGLQTAYSFIDDLAVGKGDKVSRGQTIAKVTANEFNALQFMVFKGTQTVDPTPYFN